jgi:CAAX prenyl protease-like protein
MKSANPDPDDGSGPAPDHGPGRPWLSCVAPLIVYLVGGALEPSATGAGLVGSFGLGESAYPAIYGVRLAATLVVIALAWPTLGPWLGRPSWWPPLLGLALVVPWVVLAALQREAGWGGIGRSGFDPFEQFGPDSPWGAAFLAVRFLGLVAVVPLVEELFLRGFLMRFVVREDFWTVPFGLLTPAAAGACAVYAIASHPGEAVAAVGWFAVVSGIAAATRQPIDNILAHAATNLALGIFVLCTGTWWLW